MGEDAGQLVSKDSIAFLEDVKKGKPRKFAMICKGTKIVSLVVYKKGSVDQKKKEAKESGKGDFYFGVIDGRGMEVSFKLARADGFESGPVKTSVLKQFLEEEADLKFKPLFEIVDVLAPVLDDSDPLVQRFLALQPKALQFCDANPDRSDEVNSLCLQIASWLDGDDSAQAEQGIIKLEGILAATVVTESGTSAPTPTPSPTTVPPTTTAPVETKSVEGPSELEDWRNVRDWAIQSLKTVAKEIAEAKDPLSGPAIIKIKAVIANLTESPTTAAQIRELETYLSEDAVVADVCKYAVDISQPLLDALPPLPKD